MKKLLLLITILTTVINGFSQEYYFLPTTNGLINGVDGKPYFVIEIPNKKAKDIYNAIIDKVTRSYDKPKEVIVAQKEFSYIKMYGFQPKSIGSGEYSGYDLTYNIEIEIKDGKYRFFFSNLIMTKDSSGKEKMTLNMKSGNNLFGGGSGGLNKFIFNKKNKIARGFKEEFLDLVKWINLYSKIVDVRDTIDKEKDKW